MILYLLVLLSLLLLSNAKVILNSSAVRVCPGDTLVFTCTSYNGPLIWNTNGTTMNAVFFEPDQLNSTESLGIFTLSLINITGNTSFVSTATVYNVSIEDDGTIIICSDSSMSQTKKVTVKPSGKFLVDLNMSTMEVQRMADHDQYGMFIRWNGYCNRRFNLEYYLVTHNVSSDQSPITTNRTNVTLYGVRPGETYMVNITVCLLKNSTCTVHDEGNISYQKQSCITVNNGPDSSAGFSVGYVVSILSSILLGIVILCYIVLCFCTSDFMMHHTTTLETSSNSCQDSIFLSGNIKCQEGEEKEATFQSDASPDVGLPTYDYARHQ